MNLSPNFTLEELTHSEVAERKNLDNTPNANNPNNPNGIGIHGVYGRI